MGAPHGAIPDTHLAITFHGKCIVKVETVPAPRLQEAGEARAAGLLLPLRRHSHLAAHPQLCSRQAMPSCRWTCAACAAPTFTPTTAASRAWMQGL